MAINRPDRPLRSVGEEGRDRDHDHPDRKADLQERSDGAHAEHVTPSQAEPGQLSPDDDEDEVTTSSTSPDVPQRHDAPPESPAGPQGPGTDDGPAASSGSPQTDADPGAEGSRFGAAGIAIAVVLAIPVLIYLAMIAGVFTVGG